MAGRRPSSLQMVPLSCSPVELKCGKSRAHMALWKEGIRSKMPSCDDISHSISMKYTIYIYIHIYTYRYIDVLAAFSSQNNSLHRIKPMPFPRWSPFPGRDGSATKTRRRVCTADLQPSGHQGRIRNLRTWLVGGWPTWLMVINSD